MTAMVRLDYVDSNGNDAVALMAEMDTMEQAERAAENLQELYDKWGYPVKASAVEVDNVDDDVVESMHGQDMPEDWDY